MSSQHSKPTRRDVLKQGAVSAGIVAGAPLFGLGRRPQAPGDGLVAHWPLTALVEPGEAIDRMRRGGAVEDRATGATDVIGGHWSHDPDRGLKLDGQSTRVVRPAAAAPSVGPRFTTTAWVALAAYPWNWCTVVGRHDREAGFRLGVSSQGAVGMRLGTEAGRVECVSEPGVAALGEWVHLAAVVDALAGELVIYADGGEVARSRVDGRLRHAERADLRLGMNPGATTPAHFHREQGSHPTWYSLDGYLRGVRLYDRALSPDEVRDVSEADRPPSTPAFAARTLPAGPPGPAPYFGAVHCRLRYHDDWESHWPVGEHADVLVRFDRSAARLVFWRGTSYSPAWVSENGLWMADQSVEAWDPETYEHMNDFQCRYSHVRVIHSHAARAVVHWRYAPVSARNRLWNPDPITDWACWVDEVYTVYPDAAATRTVSWRDGALAQPRQFQESIPLTHPGQYRRDVMHRQWCTVGNLDGERAALRYLASPAPERTDLPTDLAWQTHNLRSDWQPFIVFEQGNRWHYVRDLEIERLERPGSSNHWPVGQVRSDGLSSQAADRAASFLGFPISDPPIHGEDDGRNWWTGLYGMTDGGPDTVLDNARAWSRPPAITVRGAGARSLGWDRPQRAYVVALPHDYTARVRLEVAAAPGSPALNPAFVLRGWGERRAEVLADAGERGAQAAVRTGYERRLEQTDLVVWVAGTFERPTRIDVTAL